MKLFKKASAQAVFTGFLLPLMLVYPGIPLAKEAAAPQITMTEDSIRDRVKVLQQQRFDQMPYLDKGYVRSVITADRLREKQKFTSSGQKKLSDIISRAIETNTQVIWARESMSLARRRVLISLRNLFPEVKYTWDEKAGTYSLGSFNSKSYRFSMRQPLFHGGALWHAMLKDKSDMEAAEFDYEAIVEDLVNEVAKAYFEYNRAYQVAEAQRETAEKMKRFLDISTEKQKSQLITEIEDLNVKSIYGELEYDYETSKQELELAKLELQRYLDLEEEDFLSIAPLYDMEKLLANEVKEDGKAVAKTEIAAFEGNVPGPSLAELTDLAYQHRAKLKVESAQLEAARFQERIRWADMLPQADVTLEFGKLAEALDSIDEDPGGRREFRLMFEMKWNAMGNTLSYNYDNDERAPSQTDFLGRNVGSDIEKGSFSVGLFDGLYELAAAKEAEVQRLNQVVELEKAEKEVMRDVKKAYFDYQKALIQVRSAIQKVEYQRRMARWSEYRLGKNEVQISEYMKAESDYLRAVGSFHKALSEYFSAKARLNHDIGIRNYLPIEEWYGS